MSEIGPVQSEARIQSLDVMRGFAVLGILIVNAAYFSAPWQATQNPLLPPLAVDEATLWSWLIMHVFFEFKCITLFSILFGASIFLVGGERTDKERGAVLRRRLFWLLIFGLIHALLIWSGDILVTYAMTGFLVLFARSWRPRTLLIVGGVLYAVSALMMCSFGLFMGFIPADQLAEIEAQMWAPPADEIARVIDAYRSGMSTALAENFTSWTMFMMSSIIVLIMRTAGVMMIGLALFKWGYLSARAPVWVYLLALVAGIASLVVIGWESLAAWEAEFDFVYMQSRGIIPNIVLSLFVSIGYAALFALLVKGGVSLITAPLAAVGRMAFTNYITQSLIMTTIFWGGRGFGLFGQVDRPTLLAIVLAVWALQLVWSPLWLSRFQMGPLEWIWRRLSYKGDVRLRREISPAAAR